MCYLVRWEGRGTASRCFLLECFNYSPAYYVLPGLGDEVGGAFNEKRPYRVSLDDYVAGHRRHMPNLLALIR